MTCVLLRRCWCRKESSLSKACLGFSQKALRVLWNYHKCAISQNSIHNLCCVSAALWTWTWVRYFSRDSSVSIRQWADFPLPQPHLRKLNASRTRTLSCSLFLSQCPQHSVCLKHFVGETVIAKRIAETWRVHSCDSAHLAVLRSGAGLRPRLRLC